MEKIKVFCTYCGETMEERTVRIGQLSSVGFVCSCGCIANFTRHETKLIVSIKQEIKYAEVANE